MCLNGPTNGNTYRLCVKAKSSQSVSMCTRNLKASTVLLNLYFTWKLRIYATRHGCCFGARIPLFFFCGIFFYKLANSTTFPCFFVKFPQMCLILANL